MNKITENFQLNSGYGTLQCLKADKESLMTSLENSLIGREAFLKDKWNYGTLVSLFKTMPFQVVVMAIYGSPDKAAKSWKNDLLFTFWKGIGTIKSDDFARMAEKFISLYRDELKDYLKILCYEYGQNTAFKTIDKVLRENHIQLPFRDLCCLKYNKVKWRIKCYCLYLYYRKRYESFQEYAVRYSPFYRRIAEIERRLNERDQSLKKNLLFS